METVSKLIKAQLSAQCYWLTSHLSILPFGNLLNCSLKFSVLSASWIWKMCLIYLYLPHCFLQCSFLKIVLFTFNFLIFSLKNTQLSSLFYLANLSVYKRSLLCSTETSSYNNIILICLTKAHSLSLCILFNKEIKWIIMIHLLYTNLI